MSEQKNAQGLLGRRGDDQVTPEEKIYPLRFIVSYVLEKKNLLLELEGKSLHQVLALQAVADELQRMGRQMLESSEGMDEGKKARMIELMDVQRGQIEEMTLGITRKGLAFEAQPFIMRLLFRDTLTDTYNRYFFISRSAELLANAPPKIGFSLAFFDIDNFKRCNDVYGHEFGDEALRFLCRTINEYLLMSGLKGTHLVRMGGDEFILISNELAFPHFVLVLDDLQRKISAGAVRWEDVEGKITVSIGAANNVFGNKLDTPWEVYHVADERLYAAKARGKNCIVSSG